MVRPQSPDTPLALVTGILDELDIRYVVGGSLASGIHGELRATNDVDLLIELPLGKVTPLVRRAARRVAREGRLLPGETWQVSSVWSNSSIAASAMQG